MLMETTLLLSACILVALSVVTAGRFRFVPVREGNSLDRSFIKLQFGLNVLSIPLAAVLPILTRFEGQPWLAYIAVALVSASLAMYPVQLPALPSTQAKRSVETSGLRRTR